MSSARMRRLRRSTTPAPAAHVRMTRGRPSYTIVTVRIRAQDTLSYTRARARAKHTRTAFAERRVAVSFGLGQGGVRGGGAGRDGWMWEGAFLGPPTECHSRLPSTACCHRTREYTSRAGPGLIQSIKKRRLRASGVARGLPCAMVLYQLGHSRRRCRPSPPLPLNTLSQRAAVGLKPGGFAASGRKDCSSQRTTCQAPCPPSLAEHVASSVTSR